jgi:hypothetical protein
MKKFISKWKDFLLEYKDDILYLLLAGIPAGLIEVLLHHYFNFSILY